MSQEQAFVTYVDLVLQDPVSPQGRSGGISGGTVCAILTAIFTVLGFVVILAFYWKDYKRTGEQKRKRRKVAAQFAFNEAEEELTSPMLSSEGPLGERGESMYTQRSPPVGFEQHPQASWVQQQQQQQASYSPYEYASPQQQEMSPAAHLARVHQIAADQDLVLFYSTNSGGMGNIGLQLVQAAVTEAPASESDVYSQGDLILAHPVEATTVFLTVLLISGVLEFFIDTAADVDNKYFRVMFAAISQEVMIIGVMVLLLIFAETVHDWPPRWILIFKWSMMCLFLMVISFVIMILILLGVVTLSDRHWRKFEAEKMDSGAKLSSKEQQYKNSCTKFQVALQAFGYDSSQGIMFSVYMSKLQRRNVVSLTDLTWVSWVCLATLVILNAIRAEITRRASEFTDENIEDEMSINQRVGNYLSFVLFIGYFTLSVFLFLYWKLSQRLNQYLGLRKDEGTASRSGAGAMHRRRRAAASHGGLTGGSGNEEPLLGQDALDDSRIFLFRRSQQATLEMVQVIILCFEWYLAAFFLSYAYQIIDYLGALAIPIMIVAIIPIAIFMFMCPWLITMVTMLGNLGNNLQESLVHKLLVKAGIPEEELPGSVRRKKKKKDGEDDVFVEAPTTGMDDYSAVDLTSPNRLIPATSFAAPPVEMTSFASPQRPLPPRATA